VRPLKFLSAPRSFQSSRSLHPPRRLARPAVRGLGVRCVQCWRLQVSPPFPVGTCSDARARAHPRTAASTQSTTQSLPRLGGGAARGLCRPLPANPMIWIPVSVPPLTAPNRPICGFPSCQSALWLDSLTAIWASVLIVTNGNFAACCEKRAVVRTIQKNCCHSALPREVPRLGSGHSGRA
jgi:hypothetical protein